MKKREGHKRKEQCGVLDNTKSSQSRARVREYLRVRVWDKRRLYDEAGAAADEIMATCFGSLSDHNKWAARMYEYPWAIKKFVETAHEKASCYRAGVPAEFEYENCVIRCKLVLTPAPKWSVRDCLAFGPTPENQ